MLFFIIFILCLATSYILPWWSIAIIAFAAAMYAGYRQAQAFFSGFGAIFCVWIIIALFKSIPNNHMLATRVAALFGAPHWLVLLGVTALIGGVVGGTAALSGYYVKRALEKPLPTLPKGEGLK